MVYAMLSGDAAAGLPIGVGAVGVWPDVRDGILADLPLGRRYELRGFSNEGLDGPAPESRPAPYHADYNVLLQDPAVELVLVDGPVERRRDFAVRALNAGKHVAVSPPFAETARDAARILRTAGRQGRVATMDLPWRSDPDLRALRTAIEREGAGPVTGLMAFWTVDELLGADPPAGGPLLEAAGMAVLDQLNILARQDVCSVMAHADAPEGHAGRRGFLVYLPLRNGGWAIGRAGPDNPAGLPRFVLSTPSATFTARDGTAEARRAEGPRRYRADPAPGFWDDLHRAVRRGGEPAGHPVDIVRAMRLHEAALSAVEAGRAEPV